MTYLLLCFILTSGLTANACTIFMANDGKNVWIGNNEDELQNVTYRIWYYPAEKNNYGYSIWTELSFGKLLNGLSYLNPQGGLNEYGLFMDFTAIAEIPIIEDKQKKDRKKQVVTNILKKCKTVNEALAYLNQYNLIGLKHAQLFIGDRTGNYATVTGRSVIRKTDNNFALTNYCIDNGYKEPCYRREVVSLYLNTDQPINLARITTILEKSSQKLPNNLISNYSMAIDLKTSTIYLYSKNDFSTVATLPLMSELKKVKHHQDIIDYFPKSITPVLEKQYIANGIDAATDSYSALRKNGFNTYNFKNDDAINLAINWIEKGKTHDAIKLLTCLKEFDSQKTSIYSWLGVAYRKENNSDESKKYFNEALQKEPNNYVATLFGKQVDQKVTFKLPDFEGATQVSIMGDFTKWTKNPVAMKKENGFWTCEITLPKGEVIYKFLVNNQYLADSKNFMHIGTGPDIFSKLYVW